MKIQLKIRLIAFSIISIVSVLNFNYAFCQKDQIDWNKIDIVGPHCKKTDWTDISIIGPESKIVRKKFPYLWLTPLGAIPILYATLDKEEVVNPPAVTCRDITVNCGNDTPPPDPSSVLVESDCTEGQVNVSHVLDQSNNATSCVNDPLLITRTYKVIDGCGNEVFCTHTIFVVPDSENPTITCPNDLTLYCGDDIPEPDLSKVVVLDDCTPTNELVVTFLSDENNGGTGCNESPIIITRSFQVRDLCGNTSSCSQIISFQPDNIPPEIIIEAKDLTVECDGEGNTNELDSWLENHGGASVEDECSNVTWTNNFSGLEYDCGKTGMTNVAFYATDDCGNQSQTNATFIIEDSVIPTIECPEDITISCEESREPEVTGQPSIFDVCSDNITVEYTDNLTGLNECSNTGSLIRTFLVSDECGNSSSCTQLIIIEDLLAPVITAPAFDISVECDGQGNMNELDAWLMNNGGASAEDNCSNVTWTNNFLELNLQCGNTGMTPVIFYATDECGNQNQTNATFIINDNLVPTITCPADITISCEESTDPSITGQPIATDLCSNDVTTEYIDDISGLIECGGTGTIIRTFAAIDECGNAASCVQLITINDLVSPIITCPVDVTIECGTSIDPINTGLPLVENNCGSFSIEFADEIIGDCPGVITRVFTIIDECGNSSTCSQLINVAGIGREAVSFINLYAASSSFSIIRQNEPVSVIQESHTDYIIDMIKADETPNLPFETSSLNEPKQQLFLGGPFYGLAYSKEKNWGGLQSFFLIRKGTGLGLFSTPEPNSPLSYWSDYTAYVWEPTIKINLHGEKNKSIIPFHFKVGGTMYLLSMDRMQILMDKGQVQNQLFYLQKHDGVKFGICSFTSIGFAQRFMDRGNVNFEIRSQAHLSFEGLQLSNRGVPNFNLGFFLDLF